jgi:protein gp37
MGKDTRIAWCDSTFNPWFGCTKVDACCKFCYAEGLAARFGTPWGPAAERRRFGAKHWAEPLAWDRAAAKAGKRARVFCGSMCDVGEDRRDLDAERERLWNLIEATSNLDWMLLTKRIESLRAKLPWPRPLPNVWVGATVGHRGALGSIALLRDVPAAVRFVSAEPLIEDLGALDLRGISLVILGGESGPRARPCNVEWIRAIVRQCREAGVACWVKQLGAFPVAPGGRSLHWEWGGAIGREAKFSAVDKLHPSSGDWQIHLRDRAGANPDEWPADLKVRQMPEPHR